MYNTLLKPLLFKVDAEKAHHLTLNTSQKLLRIPGGRFILQRFTGPIVRREYQTLGLSFRNKVGLAAGMDKDAQHLDLWDALGFGFAEIGTVTPLPQDGNPKPRLFRLPKDRALINRMGFNNEGLSVMRKRLESYARGDMIVGGNIGKNKVTPNEDAWKDYVRCFDQLQDLVDYFVINVSSPNTPGLRALQEKEPLLQILSKVQELNHVRQSTKPILLKVAPDMHDDMLKDILDVVRLSGINGLVLNNTTINRSDLQTPSKEVTEIGNGGLSGAPLRERSLELMKMARSLLGDDLTLIGVGGIMNEQDAQRRVNAGANLVQIYTGMIYAGPQLPSRIARQLD